MYKSDEQLHSMDLSSYHVIKVQVQGLEGERRSEIYRYTGSQSWCRGVRRNDWVSVPLRPGRCYVALNGCLPWKLQGQSIIKLRNEDRAFVEF